MFRLIFLLLVPLGVAGLSFLIFKTTITVKEFALQVGLSVSLAIAGWMIARWGGMQSTEHWNGHIIDKRDGTESCCHCRTECNGRDKDGNCTSERTVCDHILDYWWAIDVSTGDTIHDGCHGFDHEPAWWAHANVGEAASVAHSYTNYLQADPESILHHSADPNDLETIPPFPQIYDKYKVSKVVVHGGAQSPRLWQSKLLKLNDDLGEKKQVDIVVFLTTRTDPEFAFAVEAAWLYGPKNSLTIVMGTDGKTILWARTVTISDVQELSITIRDELPGRALDDPDLIDFIGNQVRSKFTRTPMANYEYLASAAVPKGWQLVLLYFLVLLISIGLTITMHVKDIFGDERRRYRY